MFSQHSFSEQVLSAEHDQHIFANNLKRKLETDGRNGFVSSGDHNEVCAQRQENCSKSEKRPRFSGNGELNCAQTTGGTVVYPGLTRDGNMTGTDSLLQSNLEWKLSREHEESAGMDVECEMAICAPNLNVVTDAVDHESSNSDKNSPMKGSPAREFLQRHRPEYQMHCIPSYCHPGGLWDVMLEVYHGL